MAEISDEEWEKPRVRRIPRPPTALEQARFDAWKAKYLKLQQKGYDNGWLTYGDEPDYINGPNPGGYDERPETEEERLTRVNSRLARMTENMLRSLFDRPTYDTLLGARLGEADASGIITIPVVQRRPTLPVVAEHLDAVYRGRIEEDQQRWQEGKNRG